MKKGFLNSEVLYWKLYKLNVQSVVYDKKMYEEVKIPLLKNAWDYIQNSYSNLGSGNSSNSNSEKNNNSSSKDKVMQDISLSLL